LTSISKENINERKMNSFEFEKVVRTAFKLLKISFIRAPILIHFNSNRSIRIEINISEFAIAGILSQLIDKQLTSNLLIYRKLKNDNSENLNPERLSHLTIKKKSKYFQIY
jgi:hypothetical protein